MKKITAVLIAGIAIALFGWFFPAIIWSICKWSMIGLFIVCLLLDVFGHTDREPYQKDGLGSFYEISNRKERRL